MKIEYKKIKHTLSLFLIVFIAVLQGVYAQSNLTKALGITVENDLISVYKNLGIYDFSVERDKLKENNADCFLITAQLSRKAIKALGAQQGVFTFALGYDLFYQIGVRKTKEGKFRWFIRRALDTTKNLSIYEYAQEEVLDYEIYDDLGVDGKLTFILGHYFTAIAVDEGASNYKMAPVFFGMDSNLGYIGKYKSHMGEFTGETDYKSKPVLAVNRAYEGNRIRIFKMSGDAKISTVLKKMKGTMDHIENKMANNKIASLSNVNAQLSNILEDSTLIENLELYPNPSKGTFYLDFGLHESSSVSFKIFNLNGQIVYEDEGLFDKGNNKYTVNDVDNLPVGVYIFKVTSRDFTKSLRLVIK
jgi:hypothetical protein